MGSTLTIEPAVLIGAIATLGGLLIFVVRLFLTGAVLPRSAVPREDFEALRTINASLSASIPALTDAVNRSMASLEQERTKNGGAK